MSMSVGSGGDDQPMMEINTTPLIDVMLVLLIMLILNLPAPTHAVKLDMPQPSAAQLNPPEPPPIIELEVDFDGTYLWNGQTPVDFATLDSYFRQEAARDPQPQLQIRPNPRAKYDFVAKALAAAQRHHIVRIGFVGNEQFMD